ncbi:MAG: ATP-binding protein, partial [Chloroflexi bacterium]|nr:ATP-binding protein [Chloroflexota bacterium]
SAAKASFQFKQLAEQVRDTLGDKTLILALDEFEAIEKAVGDGKISSDIFQFLRTTSQQKWLTFIFGGLHTLEEMSRDYQQPFYNSYVNILVSYLSPEVAWNLITDPDPNFKLNYEPAAVAQIITVSGGQPSLLQQLCRDALNHLNHELFDLNLKRDVLIKLSDVEAVLDSDFFRRGAVYFDGVWNQTENDAQRLLLRQMAGQETPWSLDTLAA